jgi:hypothetical protein
MRPLSSDIGMDDRQHNMAHALDAGFRSCFIRTSLARASDVHR